MIIEKQVLFTYFEKMLHILLKISNIPSRRLSSVFTSITDDQITQKKIIDLYTQYLGITKQNAADLLQKNPKICGNESNYHEIEKSLKYLSSKFSSESIISRPTCLLTNPATYENRQQVFKECLFHNIQLSYLTKYVSIMNKNVAILKAYDYIIQDGDVINNLKNLTSSPIKVKKKLTEQMSLNEIRREIMNSYLQERLKMSEEEIIKTHNIYKNLKHRSFKSVIGVINLLLDELNYSRERIIRNSFLLHARPENIREIINNISQIADVDIKKILLARPKIMMQSAENIKTIINHVKKFNIPESSILKCYEIFTLSPETVYFRLAELHEIKEFSVMFSNPRILRLIHYHNRAKSRLEYLKQLKVKCFSLNLLSGANEVFEKHVYMGEDKTKGKEIVEYLSAYFNLPTKDIREVITTHPYWIQIPVLSIKQTIEFLHYNDFTKEDMLENIFLLLYPVSRVKPKLDELLEWATENNENRKISDVEVRTLSNSKLLNLCLYFIESEYHFTGDAVFEVNRFDGIKDMNVPPKFMKKKSEHKTRYGIPNEIIQEKVVE